MSIADSYRDKSSGLIKNEFAFAVFVNAALGDTVGDTRILASFFPFISLSY